MVKLKSFIPNISHTTSNGLCLGCGMCKDICPSNAISIENRKGQYLPVISDIICNNKRGCHRCYDICPGLGCDLNERSYRLFTTMNVKNDVLAGRYINCYTGYSTDEELRYHSSSGGMLTQLLIWLLEKKYIDGAVVTIFDKDSLFLNKAIVATTKEELLKAKGSKYAPVSFANVIKSIKKAESCCFVVVGLPCHIQGIRKVMEKDMAFARKIGALFSLYCSSGRTFNYTEYILKERKINPSSINYLSYRDNGCLGGLVVKGFDKQKRQTIDYFQHYQLYSHPLRSIFVPRRCLLCIDHYGELADISFGDIHIAPYKEDKIGINSAIVRSEKVHKWLLEATAEGVISLASIDISIINNSQPSLLMKKNRNTAFIQINKKIGRFVPEYNINLNKSVNIKLLINYVMNRIQQFIGRNKALWFIIPLLKAKTKVD